RGVANAEDLDAALVAARNAHFDYLDQLKELSDQGNQDPQRPKKIEEYRRQIESAKHDLETLKRYPGAEQNIEDSEAQIKEVKTAIVDLENQLKALDERQAQAQAEVVIKKADFERVSQELDKIIQLQNATNDLLTRFPRLKASAIAGGTT